MDSFITLKGGFMNLISWFLSLFHADPLNLDLMDDGDINNGSTDLIDDNEYNNSNW